MISAADQPFRLMFLICAVLGLRIGEVTALKVSSVDFRRKTPIHFVTRLMQNSVTQQGLGGSVWESNPPPWPRRTGSMALKATRITGPLSPPIL